MTDEATPVFERLLFVLIEDVREIRGLPLETRVKVSGAVRTLGYYEGLTSGGASLLEAMIRLGYRVELEARWRRV